MKQARVYRSTLRQQQAAETRQRILQAARERFAADGYAATTIARIAADAGVSAQTVYAAFTSKAGLTLALIDHLNQQAGVFELARDVAAARTPHAVLHASIHLVCVLHERIGDVIRVLIGAANNDEALAPAVAAGRQSHAGPQVLLAQRLADADALHPGLSVAVAADLLTVCTSPETVDHFVHERRWSYEQIEAELTAAMVRALCKPAAARRRCVAAVDPPMPPIPPTGAP